MGIASIEPKRLLGVTIGRREFRRRRKPLVGDASWLAVPFLGKFRGRIYLQVRHPLKVISSLVGMRLFE